MLRRDSATANLLGFIVAAGVFVVSAATLIQFAIHQPAQPEARLSDKNLATVSDNALGVLFGTPGYPSDWSTAATRVDAVSRLGIRDDGADSRVDTSKFMAIAHGKYNGASDSNGAVDYPEMRTALGLAGYDYHFRTWPAYDITQNVYGMSSMGDYRVAYVGASSAPSLAANERAELGALGVNFTNADAGGLSTSGDAYKDTAANLRDYLLPLLGPSIQESVIDAGAGGYDFRAVSPDSFPMLTGGDGYALALADANGNLGYADGRELRAVVGVVDFSGVTGAATIGWIEHVDTGTDTTNQQNDYGFVEVSYDNGVTWTALNDQPLLRSTATPAAAFVSKTATCADCGGHARTLVAFHWVADANGARGYGWLIDDVKITSGTQTLLDRTFEPATYQAIVLGSGMDMSILSDADINDALARFVTQDGGNVIALGGSQDASWLPAFYHYGQRDWNAGMGNPDVSHPLLNVPNELLWSTYATSGRSWDLSGTPDAALFQGVVQVPNSPNKDVLAVSTLDAFGPTNSTIILTAYQPGAMTTDQGARFLANALLYGRYNGLYVDLGPSPPMGITVSSASRHALIDRSPAGLGDYVQITATLYLWPGENNGTSVTGAPPGSTPTAPRDFIVAAGEPVSLSWTAPASPGASALTGYDIYRGESPGTESFLAHVGASTTSYFDYAVTSGHVYYYNVTAESVRGQSSSTPDGQAIAAVPPNAPTALVALAGQNQITLSWTAPTINGGERITSYEIWSGTSTGAESKLATIGANTSYQDTLANGQTRYYVVKAVNGMGASPASNEASGTTFNFPASPGSPVVVAGYRQLTVQWTAAPDGGRPIDSYTVYGGDSPGTEVPLYTTPDPTTLQYTQTGLNDGQTRYYTVSAHNVIGNGAQSAEAHGTTFSLATAPTGLTATGAAKSIALSWSQPINLGGSTVTNYKIYRGALTHTETLLATIGANTSFVDATLGNSDTRWYYVTAVTGAGESPASLEARATSATVPGAPTLNAVTPGLSTDTLTWTAPASDGGSPITNYKIYSGSLPGKEGYLATIGTNTSFADASLSGSELRYYTVSAVNAAGESVQSNEGFATSYVQPGPPVLVSVTPGSNQLTLTWTAPLVTGGAAITQYDLYYAPTLVTPPYWTHLATVPAANTSFIDATVTNGQARAYYLNASNAGGMGNMSNTLNATAAAVPGAPTALTVTGGVKSESLSWTAPASNGAAITSYKVYRGLVSGADAYLATTTSTTYSDTSLLDGTTYYYNVTAVNSVGEGASSSAASASTATTPGAPTGLAVTAGQHSLTLSWTAPASNGGSAITSYSIYRALVPGGETTPLATIGTNTSFVDATLGDGITRYYEVTATNGVGESAKSNEASATTYAKPTDVGSPSATGWYKQINLTWVAVSSNPALTAYNVYRSSDSVAAHSSLLATIGTNTSYADATLGNLQIAYYWITATNAMGESGKTNVGTTTTLPRPNAPAPLVLANNSGTIYVNWTAPAGGSTPWGYHIYRGPAGQETLLTTVGSLATSYTDSGLGVNNTESYLVAAYNGGGETNSTEQTKTTWGLPYPPTGATALAGTCPIACGPASVNLTWVAPSQTGGGAITGYNIYRGTSAGGESATAIATNVQGLTYSDVGLTSGTTYYYVIKAVTMAGEGNASNEPHAAAHA